MNPQLAAALAKFKGPFEYHCYAPKRVGVYWRATDSQQRFVADVQISDEPIAYAIADFLNSQLPTNQMTTTPRTDALWLNRNEENRDKGVEWAARKAMEGSRRLERDLASAQTRAEEYRAIARELADRASHRKDHYISCDPEWNEETGTWENCTCGLSEELQRLEKMEAKQG